MLIAIIAVNSITIIIQYTIISRCNDRSSSLQNSIKSFIGLDDII